MFTEHQYAANTILFVRIHGEALLLLPEATARDLPAPVAAAGGALIDERVAPTAPSPTPPVAPTTARAPTLPADGSTDSASASAARAGVPPTPTRFAPGVPTLLRSPRGRVEVQIPAAAASQPLSVRYRLADEVAVDLRVAHPRIPPVLANGRRGFGTFHLDATDDQGHPVHQFAAPLTIVAHYTPEQLRVLGMNPGILTLFWFDPARTETRADGTLITGLWVPLPSTIDAAAQTVTASVDHFSAFQLGNGLSPSSAFIPSLAGWQVSTFTGAATYSYPMDVPAGPGGLKPNVVLNYSSDTNDGPAGSSDYQQASWVGRDWNLEAGGSIALSKSPCCRSWDHFVLTAMGRSFTMVRGNALSGAANDLTTTYGLARGTASSLPPTPGWNRLLSATNGYGGKVTYTYGHVWSSAGYGGDPLPANESYYEGSPYAYRFRVLSKLVEDTAAKSYSTHTLTTYTYAGPAVNTRDYAATGWYAQYTPPGYFGDSTAALAVAPKQEFRGHRTVIVQTYNGATTSAPLLQRTQSWFYQGQQVPSPCTPPLLPGSGGNHDYLDTASACFQNMVHSEAWRGRAYQEDVQESSGAALQRTTTDYTYVELPFYDSATTTGYRRAGIWRAFTGTSQVTESVITADGTSSKRTEYAYVGGCGTGAPTAYGQVVCQKEFDQQGALIRKTEHAYAAPGATYIVDRTIATSIRDSANVYQAHSQRFYDGNNTTLGSMGSKGQLTREIQVATIGGLTSLTNQTLYGTDTTFTYTDFGEQAERTTYSGSGWVKNIGSSWTASAPGNGSSASTTETTYHALFRHLPIRVTYPVSASGTPLTESASYDDRLGVLTSVTDVNGNVTTATYDPFGRLLTIRKPGDSAGIPTVKAIYDDTEQPFRYRIEQRETDPSMRVTQLFYDGLGRQVQTKQESTVGSTWRNIVTDSVYDGLGRVVQQSQARDVPETSTTFTQYTALPAAPNDATMRWTKTSYDGLGRLSASAVYDGANGYRTTAHVYSVLNDATLLRVHDVVDANRHRVQERFDSLGRRVSVYEIAGNCANSWAAYGCASPYTTVWTASTPTRYTYTPLDLLASVTDAHGNLTALTYDSLGHKTRMSDPDMGVWSYAYAGRGTLSRQTDAKGQTTCFWYDALERLTGKDVQTTTTCPGSQPAAPDASYTYDSGTNGKGQRTGMSAGGTSTTWTYTPRGQVNTATHTIAGVSGSRAFDWDYDSAERVTQITYPSIAGSSEAVTYTYDAAWRPNSVCGTACYVSNASYTALSQPASWSLGNGIQQTWSYNARGALSQLQIGVSGNLSSRFDRSYQYDGVGNVTQITDTATAQAQAFRYDERDRLLSASALTQTIPAGTVVSVHALGEDVDGWPIMELRVNGATVKSWTVNSASWTDYTYALTAAINPGDTVDIVFTNNYSNGVGDRDLFVDSIAFGSLQTVQVESRAVSYDRNSIDGQDVWASDGSMWWSGALRLTQRYSYDTLGNLTNKEGAGFTYGTQGSGCAAGALSKPHALIAGAGTSSCYDRNGNMVSGGGRSYVWNAQNLPLSITNGSVTESYSYTADDTRVKVTSGSTTTIYLEGMYEEVIGGAIRSTYTLNETAVAVREQNGATNTVTYLHGDHLGSVGVVTDSSGAATHQEYDPWGKVRRTITQAQNPIQQTKRNYTGQILDGTGLLFYNARYYDAGIGRFVSADTVVPDSASGGMDGVAVKPLTVDFHEGGFQSKLNQENRLGFWFQLSDEQQQQAGSPWGPANAQALNRYSYVQNNPLKWTDPTGHTVYLNRKQTENVINLLTNQAKDIRDRVTEVGIGLGLIASALMGDPATFAVGLLIASIGAVTGIGAIEAARFLEDMASKMSEQLALSPDGSDYGVAVTYYNGSLVFMNRWTGTTDSLYVPWWQAQLQLEFSDIRLGKAVGSTAFDGGKSGVHMFCGDVTPDHNWSAVC